MLKRFALHKLSEKICKALTCLTFKSTSGFLDIYFVSRLCLNDNGNSQNLETLTSSWWPGNSGDSKTRPATTLHATFPACPKLGEAGLTTTTFRELSWDGISNKHIELDEAIEPRKFWQTWFVRFLLILFLMGSSSNKEEGSFEVTVI